MDIESSETITKKASKWDDSLREPREYLSSLQQDLARAIPNRFSKKTPEGNILTDKDTVLSQKRRLKAKISKIEIIRKNLPAYKLATLEFSSLLADKKISAANFELLLKESPTFREFAMRRGWKQLGYRDEKDINFMILDDLTLQSEEGGKYQLKKDSDNLIEIILDIEEKDSDGDFLYPKLKGSLYDFAVMIDRTIPKNKESEMTLTAIFTKDLDIFKSALLHINNQEIIKLIASSPSTPVEFLDELLNYTNDEVKISVLKNPNSTEDMFIRLAAIDNPQINLFMAGYGGTPIKIRDSLLNKFNGSKSYHGIEILLSLARNNALTKIQAYRLYNEHSQPIHIALASNRCTPTEILDVYCKHHDPTVKFEAVSNTSTRTETLSKVILNKTLPVNIRLAAMHNPNAAAKDIFSVLNENFRTRFLPYEFAATSNRPIFLNYLFEKYKGLESHNAEGVRLNIYKALSSNMNCPSHILKELIKTTDYSIIKNISKHKNADSETLKIIYKSIIEDFDYFTEKKDTVVVELILEVVKSISSNPNIRANTIQRILKKFKDDSEILFLVAGNTATPPKLLQLLSNSKFSTVTSNVAKNPNTPRNILLNLASNEDAITRVAVASNETIDSEIVDVLLMQKDIPFAKLLYNKSVPFRKKKEIILNDEVFKSSPSHFKTILHKTGMSPMEIYSIVKDIPEDQRLEAERIAAEVILREISLNTNLDFMRIRKQKRKAWLNSKPSISILNELEN